MSGSGSDFSFLFVLILSNLGLNTSLKYLYFFNGDFKNGALGPKVLELQTMGILSCAVSCFKNNNCSFFTYNKRVCSGYDKGNRSFATKSNVMFEVYQMQDNRIYHDYRSLGTGEKYVKIHEDEQSWTDALQTCQTEGGTLMKFDTEKIRDLFTKMFNYIRPMGPFWIGLSDKHDNDTWFWTDGSPLDFNSWKLDQPDYERNGLKENCVIAHFYLVLGVMWSDTICNSTQKFVCERGNKS